MLSQCLSTRFQASFRVECNPQCVSCTAHVLEVNLHLSNIPQLTQRMGGVETVISRELTPLAVFVWVVSK